MYTKSDKIKAAILLTCISQRLEDTCDTFTSKHGNERKLIPALHKFSEYCNPRKNTILPSHKFSHTVRKWARIFMILWLN